MWIYAPFARPDWRQTRGELYRVSPSSGRVLERWSIPSMVRALLAVDADGLWIAPSIDTGGPGVIYHVTAEMRAPSRVLTLAARRGDYLLVARGHTVWFDTAANPTALATLWRLQGTSATRWGSLVPGSSTCADPNGTGTPGPVTVVRGGTLSLYCTVIGAWSDGVGALTQNVVRVVPGRHEQQQLATVTPPPGTVDVSGAVAFRGSYYFLDASTNLRPSHLTAPRRRHVA